MPVIKDLGGGSNSYTILSKKIKNLFENGHHLSSNKLGVNMNL